MPLKTTQLPIPPARACRKRGFTLLEMSIVLIIVGVITAIAASIGKGKIEEAREIQTDMKLDKIEDALMAFRLQNNRLPCPANRTVTPGNATYGVEAQYAGRCTGGSPAADNIYTDPNGIKQVAEGGLPFSTLGLPEEFAYDGWGRHITYAVALRYTETEAFDVYDMYENCSAAPGFGGLITVNDASGAARTTDAAYVLVSHGLNGHGAFTKKGVPYKGSVDAKNADELLNCHCNTSAASTGYAPTYIQEALTDTTTPLPGKYTDDVVRFRERWQMQSDADRQVLSYAGPEVLLASDASPFVTFYSKACDTYTPIAISTNPGSTVNAAAVSPDNNYWAVGGASVSIYGRILNADGTFSAMQAFTPALGLPVTTVRGLAFSYGGSVYGNYFAVAYDSATGPGGNTVSVYPMTPYTSTSGIPAGTADISGSFGTPTAYSTTGNPVAVAFHPSGSLMVVAHSNGLALYLVSASAVTLAGTQPPAPTGTPSAIAFSPDGNYLAVAGGGSLEVYQITPNGTGTPNPYANTIPIAAPPAAPVAVSFDRKSRYLAVASGTLLYIYRIDPAAATLFTAVNPNINFVSSLDMLAFSPYQHVIFTGYGINSGGMTKYIPGDEYFPPVGPMATFPSQSGQATAIAIRHRNTSNAISSIIY